MLFCRHYFSLLNIFMRKGKDQEPDPDPHLLLVDPDPGGPKTCGSCGSGSCSGAGSPTLFKSIFQPFEVGSEIWLVRSAVINWRPGKFLKKFLMIQSHEGGIKPLSAA